MSPSAFDFLCLHELIVILHIEYEIEFTGLPSVLGSSQFCSTVFSYIASDLLCPSGIQSVELVPSSGSLPARLTLEWLPEDFLLTSRCQK